MLYAKLMLLRRRLFQLILGGALLANMAFLCAQTSWTAVSSPTAQDLWGICYGGGQFVAVGTGGTILTSPDGTTWTQRSSGVDLWLVGVGYGNSLYVAVGDRGTILTSPDGIAWTPRTSGTTQRLNGVANVHYAGGQGFLAVGEGGAVCRSSDGLAWTAGNAGVSGWLRGIVSSYDFGFPSYICGQGGTLLATTDGVNFTPYNVGTQLDLAAIEVADGGTLVMVGDKGLIAIGSYPYSWTRMTVGTTFYRGITHSGADISAVGSGGVIAYPGFYLNSPWTAAQLPKTADLYAATANVAVGQGGTIWLTSNPLAAVNITAMPSSVYVGQSLTLQIANAGAAPLSYQWQFAGMPIPGATQATLTLPNVQLLQSGQYSCTVSTVYASKTVSFALTVQLTPPSLGLVDLTFNAPLSAIPSAILPLPDGRLLVAAAQDFVVAGQSQFGLARLNSDGSVDSTFRADVDPYDGVSQFLLQPDGKVVIVGWFTIHRSTRPGPPRLNPDGSRDATFAPDTGDYYDGKMPLVLLSDGRFLHFEISSTGVTVLRLTTTGALDATFPLTTIPLTPPYPYNSAELICAQDASGRVLVAANTYDVMGYNDGAQLTRLRSDGTLDATFAFQTWPQRAISQLNAAQDKITYEMRTISFYAHHLALSASSYLGRLNADGSPDSNYPEKTYRFEGSLPSDFTLPFVALLSDGSAILTQTNPNRLLRYDANGQLDRSFSAYYDSTITGLTPLPDGRLLASGNFTSINGVPRAYLARLLPDTHYASTRLASLSVRANAGSGDQTLIVGISLSGSGQKTMLVRGVGPGLAAYGVGGTLADPALTLFASSTAMLANDNWSDGADSAGVAALTAQLQDFPLTPGSKDAAAVATPGSGLYTMHITGHGGTGVALAEAYDADPAPADFTAARAVSFSARTQAGATDQTLIAGLTVSGTNTKRLLIRAVGPGLTSYGVSGVLADPVLTLYQGNTVIATNDDWYSTTNLGSALQSAAQQTGAFALDISSKDAALLITLPPGIYTAQVSGKAGSTGVALIEVYEVP